MIFYCVDCGVSGHASVAGRAAWLPIRSFTQGEFEMTADLKFVFELGIEAAMIYKKERNNATPRYCWALGRGWHPHEVRRRGQGPTACWR